MRVQLLPGLLSKAWERGYVTARAIEGGVTPASQLGTPRSVCVIESRACHVTSHRVFVWGYTAFDTLSTLFTLENKLTRVVECQCGITSLIFKPPVFVV